MVYSREKDREKLEGSLLIVCIPCMDMVKQVSLDLLEFVEII